MIIFNMGIPRSGTVWTFNVIRELLRLDGQIYKQISVNGPQQVDLCLNALAQLVHDTDTNWIMHFHDVTDLAIETSEKYDVRPFFNFRDPRDVVVSQMRLHNVSFDDAVSMTDEAYLQFERVGQMPNVMLVPYEHLKNHAPAIIFQLANRLGFLVSASQIDEIVEATSLERHREIVDSMANAQANLQTVNQGTREIRIDQEHLLTDRHIQSGAIGRWKSELNSTQQDQCCERFEPIVDALGF